MVARTADLMAGKMAEMLDLTLVENSVELKADTKASSSADMKVGL